MRILRGKSYEKKWQLLVSIFQLTVGIAAIISFTVLAFGGENTVKWIVTLILSIAFAVMGIIGIIDYRSNK